MPAIVRWSRSSGWRWRGWSSSRANSSAGERGRRRGRASPRPRRRHASDGQQLRPGALLGAELAQPQLAPVVEADQQPRGAVAQRGAPVPELKATRGHQVDQHARSPVSTGEHLAHRRTPSISRPASASSGGSKSSGDHAGRQRRLDRGAGGAARQAARRDLDFGSSGIGPRVGCAHEDLGGRRRATGVADAVVEGCAARPRAAPARRARRCRARRLGLGAEAAARDVAEGRADQAVVCCWTGTGASIAANKVPGIRAALCGDAETARGARRWNDANVLALSLRTTSPALLERDPRRLVRGGAERGRRRPGERPPPGGDLDHAGLALRVAHPGDEEERDRGVPSAPASASVVRAPSTSATGPVSANDSGVRPSETNQSRLDTRPSISGGTSVFISVFQTIMPTSRGRRRGTRSRTSARRRRRPRGRCPARSRSSTRST